jgi:energy-coupling factor transporter ATP-binding protein EcfA2
MEVVVERRDSVVNSAEVSHRDPVTPHPSSSAPLEEYRTALERNREIADALEARARTVEIARLATFVGGSVVGLLYDRLPMPAFVPLGIAGVALVVFIALVRRHRALRRELRRARVTEALCRFGVLRLERDWDGLAAAMAKIGYGDPMLEPDVADEGHAYAHDLDVFGPDSLRALLGPTPTPTGAEALRTWLSRPATIDEIRQRQSAVAALASDSAGRRRLAIEALLIDRVDRAPWRAFLGWATGPSVFGPGQDGAPTVPRWSVPFARVVPPLTIGAFLVWFFTAGLSSLVWLAPLTVQAALAFRWARPFGAWFARAGSRAPGVRRHHALLQAWESYPTDDSTLSGLQARLSDPSGLRASEEIRSVGRWLDLADSAGSMVHQVMSALLLWDVHVAVGLERWQKRAGASVEAWFVALGELEALSALATLAHDQPDWCFPVLREGDPGFEAQGLGHPLLDDDVRRTSDVRLDSPGRFLLVTGSNMSGKSTLLRSIGLATVMAQAGSVVCARSAVLTPLRTFTSMRIHDSLTGGVSLFMAELLRLKALVDAADVHDERALLYLVDEVLQGTNSEERRVAARRIIRHLLDSRAIGAVTTHDLALHEEPTLDSRSTKVHFREHVDDQGGEVLTFDYLLRPGLATSRNALRLLRIVGLDDSEDAPRS